MGDPWIQPLRNRHYAQSSAHIALDIDRAFRGSYFDWHGVGMKTYEFWVADDDDHLMSMVGRACIYGNVLEHSLGMLFIDLLGRNARATSIVPHSVHGLLEACKRIVDHGSWPVPVRTRVLADLERARAANEERNRVVHGWWMPDSGETLAMVAMKRANPHRHEFTDRDALDQRVRLIRDVAYDLLDLLTWEPLQTAARHLGT
ncbi:MAG: hypothetical protein CL424_09180 [Acidimicrobiaceae bacterium]|nr:hypothetical protein [Acidimicrobiaceae bacterium]